VREQEEILAYFANFCQKKRAKGKYCHIREILSRKNKK
jgi:hypothetical protein